MSGAPDKSGLPLLRLIHTADVHVGDEINPMARLAGLRAVVDATILSKADGLLVSGDLFDNARIQPETVEAALEQLARLSVPTFVTPGNHDCMASEALYERIDITKAGKHIRFFGDTDGSRIDDEQLKLSVWSRAMLAHTPNNQPLQYYSPGSRPFWQIAMAHGHYYAPGEAISFRSSPIRSEEIEELGCDYLALGHWHRFHEVSAGRTTAYYAGSPSEAGGSFASVNLVVLDPAAGVHVERIALRDYATISY